MTCPWCESENVDAEFVDVGVGGRGQQVTPYSCGDCGARQFGPQDHHLTLSDGVDLEEARRHWFRGEDTEHFVLKIVETGREMTLRQWQHKMLGYAPWDLDGWRLDSYITAPDLHGVVHYGVVDHDLRNVKCFKTTCGDTLSVLGGVAGGALTCFECDAKLTRWSR